MNVVTQLYDHIHFIFLQFTESLTHLSSLEPDKQYDYVKLLPANPERVLTMNYNLPPQTTFFIIRGSLKPIYQLSPEEFREKVHLFKSVLEMHLDQRIRTAEDVDEMKLEYFDEKEFMISRKEEVWECLSPELYTIFWYLNL